MRSSQATMEKESTIIRATIHRTRGFFAQKRLIGHQHDEYVLRSEYILVQTAILYLGLLVDHEGAAAHDVATVPHLSLSGTDLPRVLHLKEIASSTTNARRAVVSSDTINQTQ